jgi:hypothetical protein
LLRHHPLAAAQKVVAITSPIRIVRIPTETSISTNVKTSPADDTAEL